MSRIAIIGGGIGGLTAALALRQFGFEPEVFEQAPELLEVGAAIAVWPNATSILDRLGLASEITQRAGAIEQVRWLDSQGKLLNIVSFPENRTPALALQRADLQSVLFQALPANSLHLGKVFQTFQEKEAEIEARFADGSSICCDLLIGCDGLHSPVRAKLLDDLPPVFRGYTVWRGTTATVPRELRATTAIEIHGRGRRFGIGPVGLNRVGWWATANENLKPNERGSQPPDQQQMLLTLFAGWYKPVLELIGSTSAASIVSTPAFDRPATRKWGQGRATLLGDAVHPTTPNLGQGGCLAIEDAAVLARCLKKYSPGTEALRTYEELRYVRARALTAYSRIYGSCGQWQSPWPTGFRGLALSLVPPALTRRLLQMIFAYEAYDVIV